MSKRWNTRQANFSQGFSYIVQDTFVILYTFLIFVTDAAFVSCKIELNSKPHSPTSMI